MRLALMLLWAGATLALVLPLLGRWGRSATAPRPSLPDELVKDPVCGTYVVRSRAVRRAGDGEPRYFCSEECARRAAAG
jgi:hypothetical protein